MSQDRISARRRGRARHDRVPRTRDRAAGHAPLFSSRSGGVVLALHRGPRRGGRTPCGPDLRRPSRRVPGHRVEHPLHPESRSLAIARDRRLPAADRRAGVPAALAVRLPDRRQEPEPLLSRESQRHLHRGHGRRHLPRRDRPGRRPHRSPWRRHGRGARSFLDLQRQRQRRCRRAVGRAGAGLRAPLPRRLAAAAGRHRRHHGACRGGGRHPQHHRRSLAAPDS